MVRSSYTPIAPGFSPAWFRLRLLHFCLWLQSYVAGMNIIKLGSPWYEECLGGNPKDFPTQREALEEEDQLRWVGGFSSHASLLLHNSLVQVLCMTVFAVCTWVERSPPVISFLI